MTYLHTNVIRFNLIQVLKYPVFLTLAISNLILPLFLFFFVNIEISNEVIKSITIGSLKISEENFYTFMQMFTKNMFDLYRMLFIFLVIIGYSYFLADLYKNDLTILSLSKNISRNSFYGSSLLSIFLLLLILIITLGFSFDIYLSLKLKYSINFLVTKYLVALFFNSLIIFSLINILSIVTKNFTLLMLIALLLNFLILPLINFIDSEIIKNIIELISGYITYYQSFKFDFEALPNISTSKLIYSFIYILFCFFISSLHFNKYDFS